MRKVLVSLSISAAVIGACVGDDPASVKSQPVAEGALGGACLANGTCNAGLSCTLVAGVSTCTDPKDPSSPPPIDGSSPIDSGNPDAGPPVCKFQTTTYPCGDQLPPNTCFGATQSCTLTGCNSGEIFWQCNSARQCGTACCVPATDATFTAGANCTEGTLLITAGTASGAICSSQTACDATQIQLCQANSDCPAGQHCSPAKVIGAPASLNGNIVAACVK